MADTRTPSQRRRIMQAVRTKHTGPEMEVRCAAHRLGYRFRLHRKELPGSPDLVFPKLRSVIYVNGCFWHGHGCAKGQLPKSRLDYWQPKIERNRDRDASKAAELRANGWQVMTVWQCETRDRAALEKALVDFLGGPPSAPIAQL